MYYIMVNIKNPNTDEWEPMTSFWEEFRLGPDVIVKINHRDELMAHNTQFNNYIYVSYLLINEQKVVIFQDEPSNVVNYNQEVDNEETYFDFDNGWCMFRREFPTFIRYDKGM